MLRLHGNGDKHCWTLEIGDLEVLFSYSVPVAYKGRGKAVRTSTRWSPTTSRHINAFLGADPERAELVPQEELDNLFDVEEVEE